VNFVSSTLVDLYTMALETAALVTLPAIGLVAIVGVVVGLAQAITGISDQNLSFGPKIAGIAFIAWLGGPPALALVETLLREAIRALPQLAH
jgi:flagellar biosynthesis protein FliQ